MTVFIQKNGLKLSCLSCTVLFPGWSLLITGGESSRFIDTVTAATNTVDLQDPRRPCIEFLSYPFKTSRGIGAFVGSE